MSINSQADFFLNFKQFGELKLQARGQSDEAARNVARQFEGLFVQQMLSAMRSAALVDSTQHSSRMDFYQEMYDKQLAQSIAGQDRLGVARMIVQQIPVAAAGSAERPDNSAEPAQPPVIPAPPVIPVESQNVSASAVKLPEIEAAAPEKLAVVLNPVLDDDFAEVSLNQAANRQWQDPHGYVAEIWPQAQAAARQLGVSARLLVAQSALETGWGRHTMQFADGRSSYNLFGIKAGADWQGDSLTRQSLEFRDGALQPRQSRFRAYASPAHSLIDYVDFIRSSPRYQQALAHAGDDQSYIKELHRAGYATDPGYASKVIGILKGDLLQSALASLKPGDSDHA